MQFSYTIDEVCKLSSIGRTKLYQIIADGYLPAKKLGKRTLILHEDLVKFMGGLESFPTQKAEG
jgi:excisionase family DNA binding protein